MDIYTPYVRIVPYCDQFARGPDLSTLNIEGEAVLHLGPVIDRHQPLPCMESFGICWFTLHPPPLFD